MDDYHIVRKTGSIEDYILLFFSDHFFVVPLKSCDVEYVMERMSRKYRGIVLRLVSKEKEKEAKRLVGEVGG
jgi:hypothetical protein